MANQTENATEVIRKDDSYKPTAVDESRGLEYIFVLIKYLPGMIRVIHGDIFGLRIRLTFVNFKHFVGDVLKTTVES